MHPFDFYKKKTQINIIPRAHKSDGAPHSSSSKSSGETYLLFEIEFKV